MVDFALGSEIAFRRDVACIYTILYAYTMITVSDGHHWRSYNIDFSAFEEAARAQNSNDIRVIDGIEYGMSHFQVPVKYFGVSRDSGRRVEHLAASNQGDDVSGTNFEHTSLNLLLSHTLYLQWKCHSY